MFLFSDCKQIRKFPFGDVPQNSFKIWETTETKHPTKYQRCLVMCWNALFFNLFGGSKVTVNKCPASNVTAPEHNNQFGVYKKFIFCKVTVNKQQHRYIGIHKKAIIIRVVNGLAFSMVTVFEDFSLQLIQINLRHISTNSYMGILCPNIKQELDHHPRTLCVLHYCTFDPSPWHPASALPQFLFSSQCLRLPHLEVPRVGCCISST